MPEILALLQNIAPVISTTTLRQLSQVVYGMLISNGRMTMLELSRWTEKGGSYRTIQRLYHTPILWLQIQWILFTSQFHQTDCEYIAAGDEVVFGKAGKETHGLGRFFSSLQNRVIPGLSFFVFSLIDVQERQSYPIQAVQIIKEPKQPKISNEEASSRSPERQQEPKEGTTDLEPGIIAHSADFAGISGGFEGCFDRAVPGDGRSFWKLSKRLDGVTDRLATDFKIPFRCRLV
jgi:hypothetical protein